MTAIVIPVSQRDDMSERCLRSIREHTPAGEYRLVLVAGPESKLGPWAEGAEIVKTRKKFVFAHRANFGIKRAGRDDVILLNNDTEATPGWFEAFREHPERLAVCRTGRGQAGNALQWGRGPWRESKSPTCFVGVQLPRWVLDRVGLFDERFDAYGGEDIDYCARCYREAIRPWVSSAYLHHAASSSFGKSAYQDGRLRKGMAQFAEKWGGASVSQPLKTYAAPTVSVIMPVYNAVAYVREAIESVITQTLPVHEIIVVDDGSTDGTSELLLKYAHSESPTLAGIRYFRRKHKGAAAARNFGARRATGTILAFQDADDWSHPNRLELQLRYLAEYPGHDICHTAVETVSARSGKRLRNSVGPITPTNMLSLKNSFAGATMMIRRSVWLDMGGQNESEALNASHDFEFALRALERGLKFVFLDNGALYRYRRHEGNISGGARGYQQHCWLAQTFAARLEAVG